MQVATSGRAAWRVGSPGMLSAALLLSAAPAVCLTPSAASPSPRCVTGGASRCTAGGPSMIIDQLRSAVDGASFAAKKKAAEVVVEQKVSAKLEAAQQKYTIPEKYVTVMRSFFTSYMTEIYMADLDMDYHEGLLTEVMKQVLATAKEPYMFEPYHQAIRDPYDYYALGTNFAAALVDSQSSEVIGLEQVSKMRQQLDDGDNVVLFANHQSEADPQIFSVLLDPVVPGFAESTVFVAGDRVTTDLLAMPFSMGRNLLCIFSKKHVNNPPEQKARKQRHNRMAMKTMQNMFKEGGKCIWVAPSGGRDRPGPHGEYEVAPFDAKSIEMFRLMSDKAGRPAHFYPLSMFTYAVCPPPLQVGGEVGEVRTVKYAPAALHFGEEVDLSRFAAGCVVDGFPEGCTENSSRDELREALAKHIHGIVVNNYGGLSEQLEPLILR